MVHSGYKDKSKITDNQNFNYNGSHKEEQSIDSHK